MSVLVQQSVSKQNSFTTLADLSKFPFYESYYILPAHMRIYPVFMLYMYVHMICVIYIYIYIYICVCVCVCVHQSSCMHVCVFCISILVFPCVSASMNSGDRTWHVYVYLYVYLYIYIYIYIYIYMVPPSKIHAFQSVLSSSCAIPAYLCVHVVCMSVSHVNTPIFTSSKHTHTHTNTHTHTHMHTRTQGLLNFAVLWPGLKLG